MDTKDWIQTLCAVISATCAIIATVVTVLQGKKKTTPRKPRKHKRKR